jgi:hypothetical protein
MVGRRRYLTEERYLSSGVLAVTAGGDAQRERSYGSAWLAHRANDRRLTGIETRGLHYRGFNPNGEKTLLCLLGSQRASPGWSLPKRQSTR